MNSALRDGLSLVALQLWSSMECHWWQLQLVWLSIIGMRDPQFCWASTFATITSGPNDDGIYLAEANDLCLKAVRPS